MHKYWIENLPGIPPLPACPTSYSRPDRVTASFIEEGYFVEYFEFPFNRDRTIALLYAPGEFIIRTHPVFSTIQALDRSCATDFSHSNIFRTLRNFPEAKTHYRRAKELHKQKVADRLTLAKIENPVEQIRFLQEIQPWILSKLPEKIVAGYLGISVNELKLFLHSQPAR